MTGKQGLAKQADRKHAAPTKRTAAQRSKGTGSRGAAPRPDLLDQEGPRSDEDVSVPASGR